MSRLTLGRFLIAISVGYTATAATINLSAAVERGPCECIVPESLPGTPLGSITGVSENGDVTISQIAGYVRAINGDGLMPGTRVIVGAQSWASVRLGENCQIVVPESSTLRIDPVQGGQCAWYKEPKAPVATTNSNLYTVVGGVVVVGGLIGGAIALSTGDDKPVSDQ